MIPEVEQYSDIDEEYEFGPTLEQKNSIHDNLHWIKWSGEKVRISELKTKELRKILLYSFLQELPTPWRIRYEFYIKISNKITKKMRKVLLKQEKVDKSEKNKFIKEGKIGELQVEYWRYEDWQRKITREVIEKIGYVEYELKARKSGAIYIPYTIDKNNCNFLKLLWGANNNAELLSKAKRITRDMI